MFVPVAVDEEIVFAVRKKGAGRKVGIASVVRGDGWMLEGLKLEVEVEVRLMTVV